MIKSSGLKSASGVIYTGRCKYWGSRIVGSASNEPTVKIYDNTDASGTVVDFLSAPVNSHIAGGLNPNFVRCFNGLYGSLVSTGDYIVYYEEE